MTDLSHRQTGFYAALIVLTVAPIPATARVRALHHPAFRQRHDAFRARWTRLHLNAPTGPMRGHPGGQGVMMIRLLRNDRHKTWPVVWRAGAEQARGRHPFIETRTGHQDGPPQAHRIDHQLSRASFAVLAPSIPARGTADLGGLERLASETRRPGGRFASCCHARAFAPGRAQLGPGLVVAPLGTVSIDRTFGQQIMGQHVPLATAPVQRENRVADFPHVDRTRAPAAGACLAGGSSGATRAQCSSVRCKGYVCRDWSFFTMFAHSSADGICAHDLTHLGCCEPC